MWHTIFRITDGAVENRFDRIDLLFFCAAFLLAGIGIGEGAPIALTLLRVAVVGLIYAAVSRLILYIRRLCFERLDIADRMYWEHHE